MRKNDPTEYQKYFRVLGIAVNSTREEIKTAYLRLIKQWHPDKFPDDSIKVQEATEKSKELNAAFEILKNYKPAEEKATSDSRSQQFSSGNRKSGRHDIARVRVKSSNIFSMGYDSILNILQVEFRDGSVYEYYGVSEKLFSELMTADSKGKFANQHIFYSYPYARV